MKTPRTLAIATFVLVALLGRAHAQYTDLLSLSDPPAFGPLTGGAGFFSDGVATQGATGIVVNGAIANGQIILAPIATSQDWTAFATPGNYFSIFMITAAPNPNAGISLEFLDSGDATIDVWTGFSGDSAVNGYVDIDTLGNPGTGDYSDVAKVIITWGTSGPETIDTTMTKIAVVPEPSTYALLALSGLAFGGYIIRRRRRA